MYACPRVLIRAVRTECLPIHTAHRPPFLPRSILLHDRKGFFNLLHALLRLREIRRIAVPCRKLLRGQIHRIDLYTAQVHQAPDQTVGVLRGGNDVQFFHDGY
ncbi:unknown [Clostridium sp. CAG:448]|nr:unknown [Clostridium sp. CAG:448]